MDNDTILELNQKGKELFAIANDIQNKEITPTQASYELRKIINKLELLDTKINNIIRDKILKQREYEINNSFWQEFESVN